MKPNKPFELLIDADTMLYQSALASEEETEWDNDIWTLTADLKTAKDMFNSQLTDLIHLSGCSLYTLCFTGSKNFRKDVSPSYKLNRKGKRKPVGYKQLREWAMDEGLTNEAKGRAILWDNLEADDVVGILASEPNPKNPRVIYSVDKDLENVAGVHFKIDKKDDFVHPLFLTITPKESYKNFLKQCLMGDQTDGYIGVRGYGEVKSNRLIEQNPNWRTVLNTYISAGMTEDDAVQTARLAHILHWDDYNISEGKIRLWQPTENQTTNMKDIVSGCTET